MAIFHLHAQVIKRSAGRSAVAAAAYRAGEKLRKETDGITHDYTRKSCVVHTEILLPKNAPKEYADRATLWNAVEKFERRKDAQTAREMDVALPFELDRREQIKLVREYVQENFVSKGMCADFAIHDKNDSNPHAHIMLTMREVSESGFGNKNRDWNKVEMLEEWRENWAKSCNVRLEEEGFERIDHRTLASQGIDREPTLHIGPTAKAMEKSGKNSDRMHESHEIIVQNKAHSTETTAEYMHDLKQGYVILDKETTEIKQKSADNQREIRSLQFRIEKIDERAKNIESLKNRIQELREKRQEMGFFESKRAIDEEIRRFENSHEQAEFAFKREFYISTNEVESEKKRLEFKANDLARANQRLTEHISPILAEKDAFLLEYQRQKALAEISPDWREVKEKLSQLGSKTTQNLSPQ